MGVGGELNGAVYQAASTLNQIPDTTTRAYCCLDDDLYQLIYCFKLIKATFVLFSLMIAFTICPSFYLFFSVIITQSKFSHGYCFRANYTYLRQLTAPEQLTLGPAQRRDFSSFLGEFTPTPLHIRMHILMPLYTYFHTFIYT